MPAMQTANYQPPDDALAKLVARDFPNLTPEQFAEKLAEFRVAGEASLRLEALRLAACRACK